MDKNIEIIKQWLGTGSINIFGLPFSGKDTVGIRLAEALGGKFLSSGLILRTVEEENKEFKKTMAEGNLVPSNVFMDVVLPYFHRDDLKPYPLVLSSVGRWSGEEFPVIDTAESSGHPIKVAVLLNISEAEAKSRWDANRTLQDRGQRADDRDLKILDKRIEEFVTKTMPVVETYRVRGLLVPVTATKPKDDVFQDVVYEIAKKAYEDLQKAMQREIALE